MNLPLPLKGRSTVIRVDLGIGLIGGKAGIEKSSLYLPQNVANYSLPYGFCRAVFGLVLSPAVTAVN